MNELIYESGTDSQTERTDLLPRGGWGRDGLGVWDQQMQAIVRQMDKQHGPIVQHEERYSISCDKP